MNIGKAIRIVRQAKGIAMGNLAREASVSIPFLSLVENGKRQPSLEVVERISSVLEIPMDALLILSQTGSGSLSSSDDRTSRLTDVLARLVHAEEQLRNELSKRTQNETS